MLGLVLPVFSGCASYGVIDNTPTTGARTPDSYSIRDQNARRDSGDIALTIAFSGGGTRAAALAYGVLQELRDTSVTIDGQTRRLLDEVDTISSVSGGSFTSAYYGLFGDRIFYDYEDQFLKRNVQVQLLRRLLNQTVSCCARIPNSSALFRTWRRAEPSSAANARRHAKCYLPAMQLCRIFWPESPLA